MDLTAVTDHVVPDSADPTAGWRPGDAWLAGGTWLFSEPQPATRRLVDLAALGWPPLEPLPDGGLRVAATCTVADLFAWARTSEVPAAALVRFCCTAFLASFKVLTVATVGGNLCCALPAGPMTTLAVTLDGACRVLGPDGPRAVPAAQFVTGDGTTALRPGEVLRAVDLPGPALAARTASARESLTAHGRSAAFVTARVEQGSAATTLVVTAATRRPVVVTFPALPDADTAARAVDAAVPGDLWHDDVHGAPAWRRHVTGLLVRRVVDDLGAPA